MPHLAEVNLPPPAAVVRRLTTKGPENVHVLIALASIASNPDEFIVFERDGEIYLEPASAGGGDQGSSTISQ